MEIKCPVCGKEFTAFTTDEAYKYCSEECAKIAHEREKSKKK